MSRHEVKILSSIVRVVSHMDDEEYGLAVQLCSSAQESDTMAMERFALKIRTSCRRSTNSVTHGRAKQKKDEVYPSRTINVESNYEA